MAFNINLDEVSLRELNELALALNASKAKLIRTAINDLYLKEKRASQNLRFFVDLYINGSVDKDLLFLLLPRKDAEAIIIGSKFSRGAVDIVKDIDN